MRNEAAADPAFLNGDRPCVEVSSFAESLIVPFQDGCMNGVVQQRSMIRRYATNIPVGGRTTRKLSTWVVHLARQT